MVTGWRRGIRERDIDLLLLEGLYTSPSFRQHFFHLLVGEVPSTAEFIAARGWGEQICRKLNRLWLDAELIASKPPDCSRFNDLSSKLI